MRLIDADAFEKFIEGKYKDGESTDDIKDQMLFDLSYQPTAYDVKKVLLDLEEARGGFSQDSYLTQGIFKLVIEKVEKGWCQ